MVKNSFYQNQSDTAIISLEKAKKHLRVDADFAEENDLITSYLEAAQIACQDYIGRAIVSREFVLECNNFETIEFASNWSNDVISKVEYYDESNSKVELDSSQYKLSKSSTVDSWSLKFLSKPSLFDRDDAVIVTIAQGWAEGTGYAKVPKPIVQAILLTLSDFYDKRENRTEVISTQAHSLLRPYRVW